MIYVCNAFPGPALVNARGRFYRIDKEDVVKILNAFDFVSAIGHESTAKALTEYLQINIPFNRITISVNPGDAIIVCSLNGPRLAEGQILTKDEIQARGFSFSIIEILE